MEPSDVDSSSGTSYWTVQILLKYERTKEVGGVIQSGSGWKATEQKLRVGMLQNRIAGGRIHDVALISQLLDI